jgi:hypothetical protein
MRTIASPIRRMSTSVGTAGGSLADDRSQESAALVEHALFEHLVGPREHRRRNRQPKGLRGLEVDD